MSASELDRCDNVADAEPEFEMIQRAAVDGFLVETYLSLDDLVSLLGFYLPEASPGGKHLVLVAANLPHTTCVGLLLQSE